nr:immunoglobulin light chain junction region [Macaca mulatta]MPO03543.1 immunoglobulin light chain junction region [Macaca mulatta]MPO04060.1 immunoglobulin light chain junction region [Macaca mulatta]MPO04150.1 immunoglobulin light chain junction region [Macaca mulatta]MPO04758.1 immunoglobulin light chain junction region [Macaca mulatta]
CAAWDYSLSGYIF